ncbi:response regulator transcription factor [Endothiovibrio diazotrophicus]
MRIAILEDNPIVAELIAVTLTRAGWDSRRFTTVVEMVAALRDDAFDLLILDWSLPDGEADRIIRLVREELALKTPILIESANGDERQIVHALELGADDYVVKPLRIAELMARIGSVLRRSSPEAFSVLDFAEFQIDEKDCEIRFAGEPLKLTAMEYALACYLFRHPNELLSRDRLLEEVWGRSATVDTRTVDAHVSRLRKKLRLDEAEGVTITTLRGFGYRLELPGQPGGIQRSVR